MFDVSRKRTVSTFSVVACVCLIHFAGLARVGMLCMYVVVPKYVGRTIEGKGGPSVSFFVHEGEEGLPRGCFYLLGTYVWNIGPFRDDVCRGVVDTYMRCLLLFVVDDVVRT